MFSLVSSTKYVLCRELHVLGFLATSFRPPLHFHFFQLNLCQETIIRTTACFFSISYSFSGSHCILKALAEKMFYAKNISVSGAIPLFYSLTLMQPSNSFFFEYNFAFLDFLLFGCEKHLELSCMRAGRLHKSHSQ